MKKIVYIVLTIILLLPTNLNALEIEGLYSEKVIVYNKDENKIIYEKNSDKITSIASLTKIMTTLVAIENIDNLDETITITSNMLKGIPWDASVAGLKTGDKVTYRDLLYASMIPSGADATQALAVSLTGSIDNFVEKMNQKAKELTLTDTKFVNTTGLDEKGHYSTAKNILSLLNYALENELFKEIFETKTYTTTNGIKLDSTLDYYNKKLNYDLSYIKGSKTGYTDNAGLCLATLSNIDDTNLITITINAPYTYGNFKNIIDINSISSSLKENYTRLYIVKEGDVLKKLKTKYAKEKQVEIKSPVTISRYVEKPIDKNKIEIKYKGETLITSTTKKGTEVGKIEIYYDGELIDEFKALTSESLNFSIWEYIKGNIVYYFILLAIIIYSMTLLKKTKKE